MFFRKLSVISVVTAAIAVGLSAWVSIAFSESPSRIASPEDRAVYAPIQNISHSFGSKAMSGYFVRHVEQAATCILTLAIADKVDAQQPLTPARLRLVLYPGQVAGFDSEGISLDLTCGAGATTLLVDTCDRATAHGSPTHYGSSQRCPDM